MSVTEHIAKTAVGNTGKAAVQASHGAAASSGAATNLLADAGQDAFNAFAPNVVADFHSGGPRAVLGGAAVVGGAAYPAFKSLPIVRKATAFLAGAAESVGLNKLGNTIGHALPFLEKGSTWVAEHPKWAPPVVSAAILATDAGAGIVAKDGHRVARDGGAFVGGSIGTAVGTVAAGGVSSAIASAGGATVVAEVAGAGLASAGLLESAELGAVAGTFIPIPVVGTLIGGAVGLGIGAAGMYFGSKIASDHFGKAINVALNHKEGNTVNLAAAPHPHPGASPASHTLESHVASFDKNTHLSGNPVTTLAIGTPVSPLPSPKSHDAARVIS